ncbi:MAG TPA: response regulator [Blastocatellia bacterium]|nr:response regulator [Blastocatellia bacterium]
MGTVLVVEDDFDTLHPLAELLRLKGHSVLAAVDAEQALTLATRHIPDVIITDIALPGKSGLHFISRIRQDQALKTVPIIVISGCGPAVLVEAEAAGANFCIEKPITLDLFWTAIDLSLGRSRATVRRPEPDPMFEPENPLAAKIDHLVAALRSCGSRSERDDILRQLKECIVQLHGRKTGSASG